MEHVEVLQRKFDEFQKDMAAQEYRVSEVNEIADKLILEGHSERETIAKRKEVCANITFFSLPVDECSNFFSRISCFCLNLTQI